MEHRGRRAGTGVGRHRGWPGRCSGGVAAAGAQDYPSRPVKIIVPFPAGGTADAMPRIVGDWLSRKWGQPVVIENTPGAAGNIGAEAVVQGGARRLHAAVGAAAAARHQSQSLSEARLRSDAQFVPIVIMGRIPNALVVNPKIHGQDGRRVHRLCRANPGKITSATQGNGATSHLTSEMFQMMANVKFQHVPYRGSAPALQGSGRRHGRDHVRQSRRFAPAGEGRQAEAARGRDAQAHGLAARRADDRRDAAGLRVGGLVRRRRAAQDAAGDRRQDQRRRQRGAASAGDRPAPRRSCRPSRSAARRKRPPPTCARRSSAGTR